MYETHLEESLNHPNARVEVGASEVFSSRNKLTEQQQPRRLTWEFEFAAAGVAVVFGSEVPDGIVPQVGRSKNHIIGSAGVTQRSVSANATEKAADGVGSVSMW